MADAQAEIQRLLAERDALREANATEPPEATLARLQREIADETAIAAAIEAHGRDKIVSVSTPRGVVILRAPDAVLYKRFQDLDEVSIDEVSKLVRSCVVHPAREAFDVIAAEFSGALPQMALAAAELRGAGLRAARPK